MRKPEEQGGLTVQICTRGFGVFSGWKRFAALRFQRSLEVAEGSRAELRLATRVFSSVPVNRRPVAQSHL